MKKGMRRVSRKFEPNGCTYKYMFKTYYMQPKGTYIAYYLRDRDNNYTAICRHRLYIIELLVVALLGFCYYRISTMPAYVVKLYCPKYMTVSDNYISLNLKSSDKSDAICSYSLRFDDNIVTSGELSPGESIGNIQIESLWDSAGNYPATLEVVLRDGYGHERVVDKNVLILVNDKSMEVVR